MIATVFVCPLGTFEWMAACCRQGEYLDRFTFLGDADRDAVQATHDAPPF